MRGPDFSFSQWFFSTNSAYIYERASTQVFQMLNSESELIFIESSLGTVTFPSYSLHLIDSLAAHSILK